MAHDRNLRWSSHAFSRLQAILTHISLDKPAAAQKLARSIKSKTEALCSTPYLGQEITAGIRKLVVHRHYLITYRVTSNNIEILQIWHTAQNRTT
jgi:plasmid stabilization system protein ParE